MLPPNRPFLFSPPLPFPPGLLKLDVILRMDGFLMDNFPNKDLAIRLGLEESAGPWVPDGVSKEWDTCSSPKKVLPICDSIPPDSWPESG